LNGKVQKHQNFEQELNANKTRMEDITSTGQELIEANHYASGNNTCTWWHILIIVKQFYLCRKRIYWNFNICVNNKNPLSSVQSHQCNVKMLLNDYNSVFNFIMIFPLKNGKGLDAGGVNVWALNRFHINISFKIIFLLTFEKLFCSFSRWLWLLNLLTPWSRVLHVELTRSQLVEKFPAFYGIWRFIAMFTRVHHLSQYWVRPIQSVPPHLTSWRYILTHSLP